MRDGAARWVIWAVIILVIIALGLWGISSYFSGGSNAAPTVAKVNGEKITQTELMGDYNRLRRARPQLFTVAGAAQRIKQSLLQELIKQKILAMAAAKQGFSIGEQQLNGLLTQIPAFQVDGKFSQAQFSMVLSRAMFTPQEFLQNMQTTLLINQLRNGIFASSFVLPDEGKHYIALLQQQRDIGYMIIPAARFINKINITPAEIKNFYQQHQAQFKIPEKISIQYVEISPAAVAASIKPTSTELQRYYQNNQSNYTTPARWHVAHILLNIPKNATAKQLDALKAKLTTIRNKLEAGANFAKLAKENSEDILTLKKGGQMPWFTAGTLGPIFERTVTELKPGQVSQPVQTRYGMELIKLLAAEPQKVKAYKAVQKKVRKAYVNHQVTTLLAQKNDELANVTFENPSSLQPAAKQLHLTIKTTPLITQATTKTGITANPNIIATAFSNGVLQQGNNSDVLTLKDGILIVLRVAKHVAAAVQPLTIVKSKIIQQLRQQQAEQQARQLGATLLPKLISVNKAESLAKQNGLQWIKKINVTRKSKDIDPLILQKSFAMYGVGKQQKLIAEGLPLLNGDYALMIVTKVTMPKVATITSQQAKILEVINAQTFYDAYVKLHVDKATIKRYTENMV